MVVASAARFANDVEAARRPFFTAKTRSHTEIELAIQKFPAPYGAARNNVRTRRHAAVISPHLESQMSLLSRFKIRTKLASMVALSALSIFSIIAFSAGLSRSRMLEDRIGQMHTAVDMLVGMV